MIPLGERLRLTAQLRGYTYRPNHEPTWWLRQRLVDLKTRGEMGQVDACEHLDEGMDAAIALWRPDLIVCSRCTPRLLLTGDADNTCDRCGAVVGKIHPHFTAAAPHVLVLYGLCPPCHARETGVTS